MARRTIDEQLEVVDQRMAQLKARRQKLLSEQRTKERKARTKRLIEHGAILENAWSEFFPDIDWETYSNEQLQTDIYGMLEYARRTLGNNDQEEYHN